ncbi:MAG: bifunctional protein-serine/threonine kinase/phosphatase [Gammaproteobacteria bacterium]|nr:MAG: bifunctional protein-serine/threonine kinase/phosphatase [Gammaproteobacteria bacterium]
MSELTVIAGQHSEAGTKESNDDSCGIRIPEGPLLTAKGVAAVIADGMSGSEAGREAADSCVKGFLNDYFSTPDSWTVETSGEKILGALNSWLYSQGHRQYGTPKGLVTTLSVLVIKSTTAYLFHVGDTRIYRLRDYELEQVTHDHRVTVSADKSYLSRAMGIDVHLDIDYRCFAVEKGDAYLLTTDGIHDFVDDTTLKRLALENLKTPEEGVKAIIRKATLNKSDDNLSAQLLYIDDLPQGDEHEFFRKLTELPFPPPLEPGMVLDGYRILRELHASNRTQVYLALDTETDTQVVLKTPSVNFEDDPEYIDQFLHEEWAGKRLNSAHVLTVLEPHGRRQFLYYVTEYVKGTTLRQWMHDHPQPSLDEVRNIVEQITRGLRTMHRQEMIHQDLKPENIMIDEHGVVKIIDFGSTKIAGITEITTPLDRDNILGTRNYTAPEYLRSHGGSNRSDIYSLGVIAYEMLCGKLPYPKELTVRNMNKVSYVSIRKHNKAIPTWIDGALMKAVAINPERRHSLLSEFVYELSHPNENYTRLDQQPLIERNPVAFWRALAIIFLCTTIAALVL